MTLKITEHEFDTKLLRRMRRDGMDTVLGISGVYEAVSEYYNNEICDLYDADHVEDEDDYDLVPTDAEEEDI